jgi:DNA-binding CsgD family transcriptional regulator
VVVLEGPAGIGKTRLLATARTAALGAGVRVLAARGSELESHVPFGMVRQLFEPLVLATEDKRSDRLFEGAAARARSLFAGGQEAEPADVFPQLHGLYWLLSNLARDEPVALLFDDAHWSDAPSLHFVAYLARRIEGQRVAILLATRPPTEVADPLLARVVADPGARVLRPGPLSRDAVAAWSQEALSAEPAPAFVDACRAAAGGNPFLVGELLREVAGRGLEPSEEGARVIADLAPGGVANVVLLRMEGMPTAARPLAEAVAILGDGFPTSMAAELAGLPSGDAETAADALVRAGMLEHDQGLAYVHQVIRAAVRHGMGHAGRSRAHRRAATMLSDRGAPAEEIAAHVLAAGPTGDPSVVPILRQAAARALALGVPGSAVAYLERGLAEAPPEPERAELLLELGRAEGRAGMPSAAEHLERAIELAPDPHARGGAALELARAVKYGGGGPGAVPVLERCLAEAPDRRLAELLEVEMLEVAYISRETRARLRERLAQLREPAEDASGPLAGFALAALAFDEARSARSSVEAARLAARAGATLAPDDPAAQFALLMATVAAIWADRFDQAERLSGRLLDEARRSGSALPLSGAASLRSMVHYRRGSLPDAEADAAFARNLAREVYGTDTLFALARATAALTAIERGADEAELQHIGAELADENPDTLPHDNVVHARGCVLVARGDLEAGLEQLLAAGRRHDAWEAVNPAMLPWRSDAALVLHQLARSEDARELAAEELALAKRFGAAAACGRALRVHALVGGRTQMIDGLRDACDALAHSPAKLELAHTLVELGAAMRRAGDRGAARDPLRRGAELAIRCGAQRLARRAHEELLASGARPRRVALSGVEALTPSERRVADLAAEGRTNREIAQELYITEKTVENHLARAYDKLGVRSRTALPEALRTGAAA